MNFPQLKKNVIHLNFKRKFIFLLSFITLKFINLYSNNNNDFDVFCGKGRGKFEKFLTYNTLHPLLSTGIIPIKDSPAQYLTLFKNIYDKRIHLKSQDIYLIPKKIHQIWIGNKPFPKKAEKWRKTVMTKHPDWEYKLWTNGDIPNLCMRNHDLFNKATNFGEKADILRLEILYQFGGVYLDIDCECMKPLDQLHKTFDFYAGLRPIISENYMAIMNGMLATREKHPMIEKISDCLNNFKHETGILQRTGPAFLTKVIYNFYNLLGDRGIILPPVYLSPFGNPGDDWTFSASDIILAETFIQHYWIASWAEKKYPY